MLLPSPASPCRATPRSSPSSGLAPPCQAMHSLIPCHAPAMLLPCQARPRLVPCLALALPRLARPSLVPCLALALPSPALPSPAVPCLARPCLASPRSKMRPPRLTTKADAGQAASGFGRHARRQKQLRLVQGVAEHDLSGDVRRGQLPGVRADGDGDAAVGVVERPVAVPAR